MGIIRLAINRPVTVAMFVLAVILFGMVSLDRLALNLLPDISYPSLTIQTEYPDAAPEEVETIVTRPIEEVVGTIPGLTRFSSVSRPGQSEVVLEFSWDKEMDQASMEVREKLDLIQQVRDVEKPVILRFDPSNDPVIRMHLFGDLSLARLRYIAERELKKGLESTEGVAAAKVIGGREEQIHIEVDEKRLAELGVPITEVTRVIESGNLNRSSGSLYDQDANYLVRMLSEFRSVEEIRKLVVRNQGGRRILLGDIAEVWRGSKDRDIIARFNSKDSVELAIYKEGDANAVSVSRALRERMNSLTSLPTFPRDIEYAIVFDQSEFIEQSVNNVLSAGLIGGGLAIAVLFLFLREPRSTIIVGLAMPISVMVTFTMMHQTGISLNIMSLGGIALGVGMLVDNAIVVLESVHRHTENGRSIAQAVYHGASEVGMAVTASTLTTVAVFLPLVFVEGIAGQLFRDQALTIAYAVLASLVVALTVIPMVLALRVAPEEQPQKAAEESTPGGEPQRATRKLGKISLAATGIVHFLFVDIVRIVLADLRRLLRAIGRFVNRALSPALNAFARGLSWQQRSYEPLLRWCLDHKPAVLATLLATILLSAASYRFLGSELIPTMAQGEFSFEIKLPEGRPLERTDGILREMEQKVQEYPGVATVFASVGGSSQNQFGSGVLEENYGRLHVVMSNRRDKWTESETVDRIRSELSRYAEVNYVFSRPTLFSFKTPIEVEIYAYDLTAQREVSELVAERLQQIAGLRDVRTTAKAGSPEIRIRLRREVPARLGLDENQIVEIVRNKIQGNVASLYRDADKQIEILVRADERNRNTVRDIRDLVINDWSVRNQSPEGPRSNESRSSEAPGQPAGAIGQNDENLPGGQRSGFSRQPERANQSPQVPITLGAVADVDVSTGPSEIHRIQAQRVAVVSANLVDRDLGSVSREVRAFLAELGESAPPGTIVVLGGQNQELTRSYQSLLFAIGLAIFLVYLVMASQFESFIHPFVIIFTVPLAVVGVVLSLFLTGTTISVVVLLGVIILAGIVVNNAIVLVDYTNQLRRQGSSRREALLEAGQVRLRPILMTTITTVLGLTPMALGWGEGSEVRAPMAITVMGGLIFSTALTLVLIPVVYELVDRKVLMPKDVLVKKPGGVIHAGDWGTAADTGLE